MEHCDGCRSRAILSTHTEWGVFHFCNHCWQQYSRALGEKSVYFLDKR